MARFEPGAPLRAIRHSLRGLGRRPAFTAAALLTLALGIGATTTMFSVVESIVLRDLPYAEPDGLVVVWPGHFLGNREVDHLRGSARHLTDVGSVSPGWLMGLTGVPEPTQLSAARVSGNLFALLGVPAEIGTTFGMDAEAPGRGQVAVLSHDVWRQNFGADPAIVGRTIQLDFQSYTVAGIMPAGFQVLDTDTDLWTPLTMDPAEPQWSGQMTQIVARLAPATTLAAADAEFRTLAAVMGRESARADDWARSARVAGWRESLVGAVSTTLYLLLGSVAFLLLIAAANVANLLLVRTAERGHEFALRASLGANPSQIGLLLLGESLTLAALGGLGGVALAALAVRLAPLVLPPDVPRVAEIGLNGVVLAGAAGITLLTALVFGIAPALHAARDTSGSWLRAGRGTSRGGRRTRGVLIAVEVALALVLLAGAGLMVRTVRALTDVEPGFTPDHLLTMQLQPSGFASRPELQAYWRTVLDRVAAMPGVEAAGTVLHLPTAGRTWSADIEVEGRPVAAGASLPRAAWQAISTGYLRTAGIPLLAGRGFGPEDRADGPRAVLLNSALAQSLFPGESPLGRRIRAGYATRREWATVVGVVGSVRHDSLNAAPGPELYLPYDQTSVVANALVVRTRSDPAALAPAVIAAVREVRAEVPIAAVRSMEDILGASIRRQKSVLALLGLFASVGLVLGAIGIYGVVAYGARQRAREIGIRVALGADRRSVVGLVVRDGMKWALAGILLGLPVALVSSALLRGLVYGVPTTDPVTFAAAAAGLAAVALFAGYLPARRAAGADPTTVLREE